MVLPHRGLNEVVQSNSEIGNIQEDIISGLNDLAWNLRRSEAEYTRVRIILEQEADKAEERQRAAARELCNQRNPQ